MASDVVRVRPEERTMDNWARKQLIDWAAGKEGAQATKAILQKDLDAVADDLAGPGSSAVERALAETAAISWFALRYFEAAYAGSSQKGDGLSIRQADFHLRRLDNAHRRYLSTLKTLATVRRLALPAVQINVARQQVNNQLNTGQSS